MIKRITFLSFIAWAVIFFVAVIAIVAITMPPIPDPAVSGQIEEMNDGAVIAIIIAFFASVIGMIVSIPIIYKRIEKKHTLPKDKQRLLAFAHDLLSANGESYRTFKLLSITKSNARIILCSPDWWGITNPQAAHEILQRLSTGQNHTAFADDVFAHIKSNEHILSEETKSQSERLTNGVKAYEQTRNYLLKSGFPEDMLINLPTLAAWDYGRAAFIARLCVRLRFITEDEAWNYIQTAADNATAHYETWHEYIAAYVIGRSIAYGEFTPWPYEHQKGSPFLLFEFKNYNI